MPGIQQRTDSKGVIIDLPGYNLRKDIITADPLAVMEAFKISIRFILPRIFGYRMCPLCPRCAETDTPCSNKFGNNFEPWGGIAGMASANGCAIEYQHNNSPHAHGHVHLVSVYQHHTLEQIKELIEKNLLDPETIFAYQEAIHRTDLWDHEAYDKNIANIEDSCGNKCKDLEHDALCQLPSLVMDDVATTTLWHTDCPPYQAIIDAAEYSKQYKKEAAFVMTRFNHHVHLADPDTMKRRPLPGCKSKKVHGFFMQKISTLVDWRTARFPTKQTCLCAHLATATCSVCVVLVTIQVARRLLAPHQRRQAFGVDAKFLFTKRFAGQE